MQRRQRQSRDLGAIFVCFLSEALILPLCLCLCQCLLAVGKSLGSSSCSAAPAGFTFPLLDSPDAALRLVLALLNKLVWTSSLSLPPSLPVLIPLP